MTQLCFLKRNTNEGGTMLKIEIGRKQMREGERGDGHRKREQIFVHMDIFLF